VPCTELSVCAARCADSNWAMMERFKQCFAAATGPGLSKSCQKAICRYACELCSGANGRLVGNSLKMGRDAAFREQ